MTARPATGTTTRPGGGYSPEYDPEDYDNGATPKATGTTARPTI